MEASRMGDAAAPAPAPAPAAAPSNGAAAGASHVPAPSSAPKPNGASPRMSNGQFAPKDGAVGVEQGKLGGAPQTEAQKEIARRKYSLNVFGEKEDLELDDDEVTRRLQKLRAYEKKHFPDLQA